MAQPVLYLHWCELLQQIQYGYEIKHVQREGLKAKTTSPSPNKKFPKP